MPKRAPNDSRIVRVRLPDDLLQRLDRSLDWGATSRRRDTTRNAAIREALSTWLDDQEPRAGLGEPPTLQRPFQAAYPSLHPHHDGVPIHRLRQLLRGPRTRCDAGWEALRAEHHVDLEVVTARELGALALADSDQVHGQRSGRLRWRGSAGVAPPGWAGAAWGAPAQAGGPRSPPPPSRS